MYALTALHNFIKDHQSEEIDYFEEQEDQAHSIPSHESEPAQGNSLGTSIEMNQKRDRISNQMWEDYSNILS